MKETYYKLNREISWNIHEEVMVDHLISQNILEEVQEEELYSNSGNTPEEEKPAWLVMKNGRYRVVGKTIEFEITNGKLEITNGKEDLPYTEEIENRKLQEESKQAIDNMFGNPLEQVDIFYRYSKHNDEFTVQIGDNEPMSFEEYNNMIEGIKYCGAGCAIDRSLDGSTAIELHGKDCKKSKPFLDGMKPSAWVSKFIEHNNAILTKICHCMVDT
jgi:hypothetical protein